MLLHAYYVRDPRVQRAAHALRDAGWLVKVICLNEGDESKLEVIDEIQVIRCPMARSKKRTRLSYILEYSSFMLRSLFKLWREDFRDRNDVVIVHNMPNALVFATLPLRIRGCPVILDMHDAAPEVFAGLFGFKSKWLNKILLLEETLAMKYSSGLITVNSGVESVFNARHPWAKFLIVHNSPSGAQIAPQELATYDQRGEMRIVFHGHLHERNGVQRLIAVLPELLSRNVNATLDVHGGGPYRASLDDMVAQLELEGIVVFHGPFKPDDLPVVLAGKHLGVVLHFADDFGDLLLPVKILEYTQAGIPVLCSKLATVQSYFSDECISYFESDDDLVEEILDFHKSYSAAISRANHAREVTEAISWQHDSAMLVNYVEAKCNSR